jgi:polyferredoxin
VHVCPTGVDIRGGPNLGCIQCGLCIDACDAVMLKIGRPARLIAYDTDINVKRRQQSEKPIYRIVRARTVLYAVIIAVVGIVMAYTLATATAMRSACCMTAIRSMCACRMDRCAMPIRCASSTRASNPRLMYCR